MSGRLTTWQREILEFMAVAEGPVDLGDLFSALPEFTGPQLAEGIEILRAFGWCESNGARGVIAGAVRWWITRLGYLELGLERIVDVDGVPR